MPDARGKTSHAAGPRLLVRSSRLDDAEDENKEER